MLKRNKKKNCKLSQKDTESKAWDLLCVDLIGQYQFTPKGRGKKYQMITKNGKTVYLQAVIMMDTATGWIEICTGHSARANLVSYIVELAWLTRYPLPSKVIVECGNEILAEFNTMIQANYSITVKPIISRIPKTNSILERFHQTIGNIIHTFKVQDMVLDDENLWDGILASTIFTLFATVFNTIQYTPAQLVFGQNTILNTFQKLNWQ